METRGLQRKYKAGNAPGEQYRKFRVGHRARETRPVDGYLEYGEVQAGIKPAAKVGILGRIMAKLFGRRAA